jgi:ATP adenylyltransferase
LQSVIRENEEATTMRTMWAPWRIEYILGNEKEPGCVFCNALGERDELALYKGETTFVVMNKFPYANGHLLVLPTRHVSELTDLSRDEMGDLLMTVEKSREILKRSMNPDGFNVGLNLGRIAGAGVGEHLHFHIVPRWYGDVNALAVFGDIRVIPEHILSTRDNLKPLFDELPRRFA